MRSLHSYMKQEYSQESLFLLWQWGKIRKEDGRLQESSQIYNKMPEK